MSYDDPIVRALRERGITVAGEVAKPPAGELRYHLVVEQTVLSGTAPPAVVAAVLRGLADTTETKGEQHG